MVEYRNLGASGLKVSEICLGTMTFGRDTDEREAQRIVEVALDAGVNFFDTANSYIRGASERLLGRALKGKRDRAVVASKFFNPVGSGPNDSGTSRVHIMQAVEQSLKRLQTDHVDIYYAHHVDVRTPLEEMLRAVDDLIRQGKVRYIGCCNYEAWRLVDALWTSETKNLASFQCYQGQYSLVVRDIEQALIPACTHKGLGVVAWAPLAGGFLTGKYQPGQRKLEGTRSSDAWAYPEPFFAASADQTVEALLGAARDSGHSAAQTALRWVLDQPAVTATIVGARTADQLQDNLGASGWHLDSETLATLDQVSRLPPRYPESMERFAERRRAKAVGSFNPDPSGSTAS